ncbi:hypothetical protein HMPREF9521_02263 [Enterococcus faecalis TX2134]|nr:hypothetical protein HMPREF9521_02263 [Enterococcus faecalis TX2134]
MKTKIMSVTFGQKKKRAWDKNHFGFLLHAQKLINGGNKSNSFGNKPEFSKN